MLNEFTLNKLSSRNKRRKRVFRIPNPEEVEYVDSVFAWGGHVPNKNEHACFSRQDTTHGRGFECYHGNTAGSEANTLAMARLLTKSFALLSFGRVKLEYRMASQI